jgi:hypothetical protein
MNEEKNLFFIHPSSLIPHPLKSCDGGAGALLEGRAEGRGLRRPDV